MGTTGEPRIDVVGWGAVDASFAVRVDRAATNAPGFAVASTVSAPTPWQVFGATSYPLLPGLVEPFTTDAIGRSPNLFSIAPVPPVLCGLEVIGQAIVADPAALGGLAFTNAIAVQFGAVEQALLPGASLEWSASMFARTLVDLDEDGRTDVVGLTIDSTTGAYAVGIARNLGGGRFDALSYGPSISVGGESGVAQWVDVADLDRDGRLDLITAGSFNSTLRVNYGTPVAFAATTPLGNPTIPSDVFAFGDLDGEGALDLAVATDAGVRIYFAASNGVYGTSETVLPEVDVRSLEVADYDGDGYSELIVGGNRRTVVLELDGNGELVASVQFESTLQTLGVTLGDFDGDGLTDLVRAGSWFVELHTGLSDGSFLAAQNFTSVDYLGGSSVHMGDVDGDGADELLVTREPGFPAIDYLTLVELNQGALATVGTFGAGLVSPPIDMLDLDLDGDVDLVERSTTRMLAGDGAGDFFDATTFDAPNDIYAIDFADLDGDLGVDLLVGRPATPPEGTPLAAALETYRSTGDAELELIGEALPIFAPRQLVLADVDGDAVLDAVNRHLLFDAFTVHLGQGDGTFAGSAGFDLGSSESDLAVADLDDDGRADLTYCSATEGLVFIRRAVPGFVYAEPVAYPVPGAPTAVALVDFDGDGILDVAAASSSEPVLHILRGDGLAGFTPGPTVALATTVERATRLDLDGDGDDELVVATGGYPYGITIVDEVAADAFDVWPVEGGRWPHGKALAYDTDGDGALELLTGDRFEIHSFRSVGGLQFVSGADYASRADIDIASGDIDGDGDADLIGVDRWWSLHERRE